MEKTSAPKIVMLYLASLLVCLMGCQSTHTIASQTRNLSQQSESFDDPQRQTHDSAPQQYSGLLTPTPAAMAVVTARVKDWQQDCDQGKYTYGQLKQPQFRVIGQGMSTFSLKRVEDDYIASAEIPTPEGKTSTSGTLAQIRTLSVNGDPIASTVLSGHVWTPRTSVLGKLDLSANSKISDSPDFSFQLFKESPFVIPFANGYAINLFGQKLDEKGLIDTTTRPKGNYVSDKGIPLFGHLIRNRFGKLEEMIFVPRNVAQPNAQADSTDSQQATTSLCPQVKIAGNKITVDGQPYDVHAVLAPAKFWGETVEFVLGGLNPQTNVIVTQRPVSRKTLNLLDQHNIKAFVGFRDDKMQNITDISSGYFLVWIHTFSNHPAIIGYTLDTRNLSATAIEYYAAKIQGLSEKHPGLRRLPVMAMCHGLPSAEFLIQTPSVNGIILRLETGQIDVTEDFVSMTKSKFVVRLYGQKQEVPTAIPGHSAEISKEAHDAESPAKTASPADAKPTEGIVLTRITPEIGDLFDKINAPNCSLSAVPVSDMPEEFKFEISGFINWPKDYNFPTPHPYGNDDMFRIIADSMFYTKVVISKRDTGGFRCIGKFPLDKHLNPRQGVIWDGKKIGAIHTIIGKLRMFEYEFKSDERAPLKFKVTKEGYTYVQGIGSVLDLKTGKKLEFSSSN